MQLYAARHIHFTTNVSSRLCFHSTIRALWLPCCGAGSCGCSTASFSGAYNRPSAAWSCRYVKALHSRQRHHKRSVQRLHVSCTAIEPDVDIPSTSGRPPMPSHMNGEWPRPLHDTPVSANSDAQLTSRRVRELVRRAVCHCQPSALSPASCPPMWMHDAADSSGHSSPHGSSTHLC